MKFFSNSKGMAITGGAVAATAFAVTLYAAPMVVMPLVGDVATLLVACGALSLLTQAQVIVASIVVLGLLAAIAGAVVSYLGSEAYKSLSSPKSDGIKKDSSKADTQALPPTAPTAPTPSVKAPIHK